jgi:hypothetical protein
MSSAREDLGYVKPDGLARIPPSPPKNLTHEADEIRVQRTQKNMALILELDPEAKPDETGLVSLTIQGKRFDFWPSTNCYYIHSKGKYDMGIDRLCRQIKEKLLTKEVSE